MSLCTHLHLGTHFSTNKAHEVDTGVVNVFTHVQERGVLQCMVCRTSVCMVCGVWDRCVYGVQDRCVLQCMVCRTGVCMVCGVCNSMVYRPGVCYSVWCVCMVYGVWCVCMVYGVCMVCGVCMVYGTRMCTDIHMQRTAHILY